MAEGKLQPADSEDGPLPGAEAPDFDLSDESALADGNGAFDEQQPEAGLQGEPEGIFSLFDREFDAGDREPIESSESSEFDEEFSQSFEEMFTAVKGDDSAPLFETGEDIPPVESDLENAEGNVIPIPKLEPEPEPRRVSPSAMEEMSLDDEPLEFTPSAQSAAPRRGIPLSVDEPETPLVLEESAELFYDGSSEETPLAIPGSNIQSEDADEEGLEEFSFDESDEDELYGQDLSGMAGSADEDEDEDSESFDDFAKMALGFDDDEDEEPLADEDDFVLEDLNGAQELDPFEEISIMSSEDVAKYEPSFGADELKFQDEEPLPDDTDPFAMNGEGPSYGDPDEELPDDLDPFGDGTSATSSKPKSDAPEPSPAVDGGDDSKAEDGKSSEGDSGDGKKAKKEPRSGSGPSAVGAIGGLLSVPWKIFSQLTGILFGVLESVIGLLAKLPLVGVPFRLLGSVLSALSPALKRIIVILLIVIFFWGGSTIVGSFLPKPSAEISLPDEGGAKFSSVELKDGTVTGVIENTGDISLHLFPEVRVSERKVLQPGTWFHPKELGICKGPLTDIAVDTSVKVSFSCKVATDGSSSLKPFLQD